MLADKSEDLGFPFFLVTGTLDKVIFRFLHNTRELPVLNLHNALKDTRKYILKDLKDSSIGKRLACKH